MIYNIYISPAANFAITLKPSMLVIKLSITIVLMAEIGLCQLLTVQHAGLLSIVAIKLLLLGIVLTCKQVAASKNLIVLAYRYLTGAC